MNIILSSIFSEFKYSIRLALPLIASEVIYALSGFITTLMVARYLGEKYLAANALVRDIYIALILITIGILCSISVMVSQSYGAKDNSSISICFKQGLIMGLMFAPITILILWFAHMILVLTKQDPSLINLAKPAFRSLILTILPMNIVFAIEQFLIGINKTKMVMLISVLSVPMQIIFIYFFMFGKFGIPKSGLASIGYGLTTASCLMAVFLFCYLYFSNNLKTYRLFHNFWTINRKILFELIRIGWPLGLMFFSEVTLFAVIALMMGAFGTTILAAYQIAGQYLMLAMSFLFALTQTITVRVGNEVGRNNRTTLKLTAIVNIGISFGFVLAFSLFYIFFPQTAISADIDIHAPHLQELVKEAAKFLAIVGVLLLTDCLRLISAGGLRGLKDTRFSMFVSIIGFWCIAFPSAYLLGFKFKFGGVGIWWGIVIGLFTTGMILFTRFNRLIKHIDLKALVTKA